MQEAAELIARVEGTSPRAVYVVAEVLDLSRRRWAVIAVATLTFGLLAASFALLQPSLYRATAELIVDPLGLQIIGRDIEQPSGASALDLADLDSQALVLTSTPVLRRVVDMFGLEEDRDYQGQTGWLIRAFKDGAQRSREEREADALEMLRKDVVVKRVEGSLVFQVTASAHDAVLAANIANAITNSYLRQVAQERVATVQRAGSSLLQQVAPLRAQLDAAESDVERFRGKNGLVRSSETGLVVTQQLKDLYTQIDAAEADLVRLDVRKDQVVKASPDEVLAEALPEALVSTTMTSLRSQYNGTAREIASLGQTLMPQHPRMIELHAELVETRRLMRLELSRLRSSAVQADAVARANVANLRLQAEKLTQSKTVSSAAEIGLRQLEEEAAAIRSVYEAALGRSRELQQQQGIATQNSRVLTEAAPPLQRANSKNTLVTLMGAVFGACLGFGVAYLIETWPARRMRWPVAESIPVPTHEGGLAAGVRRR